MSEQPDVQQATEDLAYIRKIMAATRDTVIASGTIFLVWGFAILIALVATLIAVLWQWPQWSMAIIWPVPMIAAWVWTIVEAGRQRQHGGSGTGRFLSHLWSGLSVTTIVLLATGIPTHALAPWSVGPVCCAIAGAGVLVTGAMMGTPWFRNLGIAWWLAAIAQMVWAQWQLPIGIVTIIVLYIVPGFILNAQSRKQRATRHHG